MKHEFEGIGSAGATAIMLLLTSVPWLSWLTTGLMGKITWMLLKIGSMWAASKGLIFFNIGIAKVQTLIEHKQFDGTFDEAFRIINERGSKLTEAERKAIDAKVIAAHLNFGTFGSLRDG